VLKGTYLLLSENKEYLETVKKSVNWWYYNIIKELLNIDPSNLTPENIKNKLLELNSKWKDLINTWLDKLLEFYTK
jgi:hypothetical protein